MIPTLQPLFQFGQPPAALFFLIAGDLSRERRGRSAAPRAVRKDVDFHETGPLTRLKRAHEIRLGFTRKTDDHIGGKGGLMQGPTKPLDLFEKPADAVAA